LTILAQFFLELERFPKNVVLIKTHILGSTNLFNENRTVYEVMWKNTVDPGRQEMRIWCMRIACCLPKSTNTLRIRNTYWFSTATLVARTRLNVTLYVHCLRRED